MELSVQDWVILVGILLILAILLDGYRRMRVDRGEKIRMSIIKVDEDDVDPDVLLSAHELPSGGARVVRREDLIPAGGWQDESADEELVSGLAADRDDPLMADDDPLLAQPAEPEADSHPAPVEAEAAPEPPQEVIIVHVLAESEAGFAGQDILQILLACDLRFGQSKFFHRHEHANGRGAIQFSVANMVTPGQFDIDAMDAFNTPGLTFFLALPGPEQMMQAFDYMLETAQCVADNLGGALLDESRSALSQGATEHKRQRIRDLERKLLTTPG